MEHMTAHPETAGTRTLWRALPWVVAALTLAGTLFALLVSPNSLLDDVAPAAIPVMFAILGVVIAVRRPGNGIAWLFLLIGPAFLLEPIGETILAGDPEPLSFWDVLALAGRGSGFFIGSALAFLVLYMFPTGHFLSRRWSWAGWTAIGLSAEVVFLSLFLDTVELSGPSGASRTTNPIGFIPTDWWATEDAPLKWVFALALIALIGGAIPAVVVRYRRSNQTVRTQIKWVTFFFVVFAVLFAINLFTPGEGDVWGLLSTISLALIPVVITVSIIQYRLYEIDRIISRTLGYGIVVGLLAAAFFGLVALLTALLPAQNSLAVAASTLAVAALFNPIRKRVQTRIDRRFNRSAYKAEIVSEQFGARLRDSLTTEQLVELWHQTVTDHLQPASSGFWLNEEKITVDRT
ncbi:MAG: hypothetical protein PVF87_02680 [Acidimicrobiia bacterium]|jgi:hypothetical protein